MYFPKYWAKGTWSGPDKSGREITLYAWGWSDHSESHAAQEGSKRAHAAAFAAGKANSYCYPNRPLREQVLNSFSGAVLTRNSYGAEILNTERFVFVDVDLPQTPKKQNFWSSLFGGKQTELPAEQEALERLRAWQRLNASCTFRVYRTSGGLRYLLTSMLAGATDSMVQDLFAKTNADPKYANLCSVQKSFRARITPKPWRIALSTPSVQYPFADQTHEAAMKDWISQYEDAAASFASCRYVETIGISPVTRELQPLLELHDSRTKADSQLPLA